MCSNVTVAVYDQAEFLREPATSKPSRQKALQILRPQLNIYRRLAASASAQVRLILLADVLQQ